MSLRAAILPVGLLGALALATPGVAVADPCASSTPNVVSYADSPVDAGSLAPEITGGTVSVDAGCSMTVSYSIPDQSFGMLSGDFMSWFIDTDGNPATGPSSGFVGADYAIGRMDTSAALLKYNASTGQFDTVKAIGTVGDFGAVANLSDLSTHNGATMKVAGGGSWTSSSTGDRFTDWVPDIGQSAIAVLVTFSGVAPQATPATPQTAPVTPSSTAPAGPAASGTTPQTSCKVPLVTGLGLTTARIKILNANCRVGRITKVASKKFANRVIRTVLRQGTVLAEGARVDLVLGKRAHHSKKKHRAKRHRARAARVSASAIAARINALAAE